MSNIAIYHNPRCSKSRQTLALLNDQGISPSIILYLDTPPSTDELKKVIQQIGISPRELLRKGEDAYKELTLSNIELTDEQLINAMVSHPKLIERPIVIKDDKAIIGRPPEAVLDLFK